MPYFSMVNETGDAEITHHTTLKELYDLNGEKTKAILKQMEAYGLLLIGYGVDHSKSLREHAAEQGLSQKQLNPMLKAVNRKIGQDSE